MLSVEQALELIVQTVHPSIPQRIPLSESLGCVLAEEIRSTTDSPPFDKATMDGFAVRSEDVTSEVVTLRIIGDVFAGAVSSEIVGAGDAVRIMTGAPIPAGANAVIPVEWTSIEEVSRFVRIKLPRPARTGMNILPRGQAMRSGDLILHAGSPVRPQEIALLAETGHAVPLVRRPPTVGVLATGDELVEIGETTQPGQIRNSNGLMLAAQITQAGAVPRVLGIARDEESDLREKILAGLECDFLCISAGVSAGDADLVPHVLQSVGVTKVFHKVAMKPGKPLWFGTCSDITGKGGCVVFGLPGNPVSTMVCFELFVRTAFRSFLGIHQAIPNLCQARLQGEFTHRGDRHTWFPAVLTSRAGEVNVKPVLWKGSADLRSTVQANCSLSIPSGEVHWKDGEHVSALQWGQELFSMP